MKLKIRKESVMLQAAMLRGNYTITGKDIRCHLREAPTVVVTLPVGTRLVYVGWKYGDNSQYVYTFWCTSELGVIMVHMGTKALAHLKKVEKVNKTRRRSRRPLK